MAAAAAVFAVAVVVALHAPAVVVVMVLRRCLPSLPWGKAYGAMTFFCAFVARVPLAFFFLLLFPPLSLNVAWMVCCFVFRGAVNLLLMLSWRLIAPI